MLEPKKTLVILILLLALTIAPACFSTEPADRTTRVILIQGACSSSELANDPGHWVQTLTAILTEEFELTNTPPGDPTDQVIEYGYSTAGWQQDYLPADTLISIAESSAGLEAIYDYYPDSEFFIVGHSLGGIVTLDGIARYADENNQMVEHTGGIITVSSPVKGLNPITVDAASLAIELFACRELPMGERSPVWNDLETSGESISLIRDADWTGVRVVNVANRRDRVVNWERATREPPFEAICFDVVGDQFLDLNHDTLLKNTETARELLSALIDAETSSGNCDDA